MWYRDIHAPLDRLLDWCGFDDPEFTGPASSLSTKLAITSSWLLLVTTLMLINMWSVVKSSSKLTLNVAAYGSLHPFYYPAYAWILDRLDLSFAFRNHLLSNISESMSMSQLQPETGRSLQPVKFFSSIKPEFPCRNHGACNMLSWKLLHFCLESAFEGVNKKAWFWEFLGTLANHIKIFSSV